MRKQINRQIERGGDGRFRLKGLIVLTGDQTNLDRGRGDFIKGESKDMDLILTSSNE